MKFKPGDAVWVKTHCAGWVASYIEYYKGLFSSECNRCNDPQIMSNAYGVSSGPWYGCADESNIRRRDNDTKSFNEIMDSLNQPIKVD